MPGENLSLANLGGGAAAEQFAEALEKALANIADPNTDYKPAREVGLANALFTETGEPAPGVEAPQVPAEPVKLHAVKGDGKE